MRVVQFSNRYPPQTSGKPKLREALPKATFTGVLKGSELVDAYTALDCFVTTSKFETQGLVVAEALTAGAAAIGYDWQGIQDAIRHGVDGFLGNTCSDLVKAAQILCKRSVLRQEMQTRARKDAERFSVKTFGDRVLSLYKKVAPHAPPPARFQRSNVASGGETHASI